MAYIECAACNNTRETNVNKQRFKPGTFQIRSMSAEKGKFLYLEKLRNTRSATTQCGNNAPHRPGSNVIPLPSLGIKTLGLSSTTTTTGHHNTNSVNQWARARSLRKHFTHVEITVNLIRDLTLLCSPRNGKLMMHTKSQILIVFCPTYGKLLFISDADYSFQVITIVMHNILNDS
jgi:hypothetical protein